MSKKTWTTIALAAVLVAIFGVSFAIGNNHTDPEERFAGTDSVATAQIEQANPDYVVWFKPFLQPESGEVESGLFALQAGIGGVVFGFAIGALWGQRRGERPRSGEPVSPEPGPAPETA